MSYSHRVWQIGPDHYRLSWVVDYKYPSSRLRFPRTFTRDTDEAGATRFLIRHQCQVRLIARAAAIGEQT